jgi:hypothetical protein
MEDGRETFVTKPPIAAFGGRPIPSANRRDDPIVGAVDERPECLGISGAKNALQAGSFSLFALLPADPKVQQRC